MRLTGLPPGPAAGDPRVVAVLQPADRRHEVEGAEHAPHTAKLPQHAIDRRRRLEHTTVRFAGAEDRRVHLSHQLDPSVPVVALDPARAAPSKIAVAVVGQDQRAFGHGPNLHSGKQ